MKSSLVAAALALALAGLSACARQTEVADPVASATVAEPVAARLASTVQPEAYRVELRVDPSQARFSGHAEIDVNLAEAGRAIRLHARDMHFTKLAVRDARGQEQDARWATLSPTGLGEVQVGKVLAAGKLSLSFDYDAPFNRTNEGLYLTEFAGIPYAYTQFEDIDARRAFPSFDEPGFKARYTLSLVVREGDEAIGNMPIVQTETLGPGYKRVRFAETPRLSTYLVAFAVGPFDIVEGQTIPANATRAYPVPLRGVTAQGQGAKLKFALDHAGKQVEALERYFGIAYPFAKLDLLAVPDFNAGAMENPGAITFRDTLLLVDENASIDRKRDELSVTSHELAHQWFGDLVTMPWWNDIWLNEAFASWMGNRAAQSAFPEYGFALDTQSDAQYAMVSDSLSQQREIRQAINRDEEIHQAFDGITYSKGGGVLSMFESFVGEEVFRQGVHHYMVKHAWGSATAEDFIAAISEAAGKPELQAAFMSYLTQNGVPQVDVATRCEGKNLALTLKQSRYLPLGSEGKRERTWGIPFCATIYAGGRAEKSCTLLSQAEQSLQIPVAACPVSVMPNSEGAGYYRWSLATEDWQALIARLPALPAGEALSLADALSAQFRAGTLDEATYIAALPKLVQRTEREILSMPFGDLDFMVKRLHGGAEALALQARIAAIYRPVFAALSWTEHATDDANARGLRADLAQFLALTLNQKSERAQLARWGKQYAGFGGDGLLHPERVPEAFAGLSLTVAAQEEGKPFVEHLAALLPRTDDGTQRARLLAGLGSSRTPEALGIAHALFFADKMRTNERTRLLYGPFTEVATEQAQLDWFMQEFDAIKARLPQQSHPRLPDYLKKLCGQESAERVGRFLELRMADIVGAQLSVTNTRESIALCTALVEARSAKR